VGITGAMTAPGATDTRATNTRTADTRARRARRRFLEFFPDGFRDETYVDTERSYKWNAHRDWVDAFGAGQMAEMVAAGEFREVANRAVRIEARTNLLFSFEKMALRDALKSPAGARSFATGLNDWLYGSGSERDRFEAWVTTVGSLPRHQTRVRTWPVVTIFGFLARPKVHIYVKPTVLRTAADRYGFDLDYRSTPSWETYSSVLDLARTVRRDVGDMYPRDMIDIQSYLWVLGSAEYD
jgi:hypothetical protein